MKNLLKTLSFHLVFLAFFLVNSGITFADKVDELFDYSLDLASRLKLDEAEKSFKELIKKHPNHNKVKDAKYWLGRVYFARKKFEKAAIVFAEFNSEYPKDKRFQEINLLIVESASFFATKNDFCKITSQALEFTKNPTKRFQEKISEFLLSKGCISEINKNLASNSNTKAPNSKPQATVSDTVIAKNNCNIEIVEGFKKLVCKNNYKDLDKYDFLETPEQFKYLCRAIFKGNWFHRPEYMFRFQIAQRNGFRCEGITSSDIEKINKELIKIMPYEMEANLPYWDSMEPVKYATNLDVTEPVNSQKSFNRELANVSDSTVCYNATTTSNGTKVWNDRNKNFVDEADFRGLDCDVKVNKTVIASKPKTQTYTKPKSTSSSAELEAERKKRFELERKLAAIETKQKQEQQRINSDNQKPIINAFAKQDGSNAIISGRVTDNIEIAEVLIDGRVQKLKSNGTFETELYVPRSGLNVEIVAYDKKGNKASKLLKLERGNIQQASGPTFDRLNPSGKRVKSNKNALALIIGVADYAKTPANALYADKDAQQFYDYATMKLGIPSSNIKELVNDKADLGEILINVKDWLRRSAKPNKSDIYIYFAGHGLASQDGTKMYLLPYDGRPRLLENTALLRDELFKDIKQANPRSVTVFLDTCYSGVTRNEEMLIAGRPIVIKAKEKAIPDGFTLFSAASNEQISRPLEEAKHGMFSYFLMKGMEGDADTNNDNKITARELHAYVEQNVVQQSSGSQTPELQGDKDRVLVQFN